ncbi:hypothetical protein PRIPAC_72072 [Pristionchus pacificus]|uniref:Uncharacterized protein n=1 Tax=Pristionchus pacificus TaxID=54126 RepID=A0A2A6CAL5_PRIPA|nr:hypothetical protein PRIPAC_72072 [Pristionchus pacificus]|eukprot:PDM75146.1 hypothetical protein PRIPAC_40527 [Pristionchus pacificus]
METKSMEWMNYDPSATKEENVFGVTGLVIKRASKRKSSNNMRSGVKTMEDDAINKISQNVQPKPIGIINNISQG